MNRRIMNCRKIFLLLLPLFLYVNPGCTQEIQFSIELDKQTYYEGESVYLVVSLTNTGSKPYLYDQFFAEGSIHLEVKNSAGKNLRFQGGVFDRIGPPTKWVLKPSTTTQELIDLSFRFPTLGDEDFWLYLDMSTIKPDKYTVQAKYENDKDKFVSNTLTFDVVPPSTDEREACNELKNICRDFLKGNARAKAVDSLESFVSRHQGSAYIPLALLRLSYLHDLLADHSKGMEARQLLIQTCPDRGYALEAVSHLQMSQPEKDKFYRQLATAQGSSLMTRFVTSLLNNVKADK